MTIGIALLGTGGIATRGFAPAVRAVAGAELVAVLSRDRARGEAFARQFDIPEVYDDLDALLRSPRVQAVIVATPDAIHEPQVIAAAAAGVHVLCEKPMTTTYAGCLRMAEAVRASGITFAMGYTLRFSAALQRVAELLQAGRLGQVRYARLLWAVKGAYGPEAWRAHRPQAHYWALSAVGTHLLDLLRWYFGEPASVGGAMVRPAYGGPNDELSTLVFDYPGRLVAELTASVLFAGGNRLELYGDAGTLVGENLFGMQAAPPTLTCNGEPVAYPPNNPFVDEVADFVQAIEARRPPRATLDDGVRNVQILEAAQQGPLSRPLPPYP
ncbi:MAG: glucose-fructose oxidoreductase [Candidatus Tectimicrobiota bacterium]|nr:MAG: glucose-fructose oxidoreductase [Candidatus Tectomicrobia bacterium]